MTEPKIGVVGAGVMGSGIAQVFATAGIDVICHDLDPDALERARRHVTSGRFGLDRAVERGKISRATADAALGHLTFTAELDAVADATVVLEAVPERLDLKIRVFRDLDRIAAPDAILASNTSGYPIATFAASTSRPDRVIGWHWSSPAPVMAFNEIVRTAETSDETIAVVTDLATRCGKNPVVVHDTTTSWGFVANRILVAMLHEAERIVADGVATREQIDTLMVDCFRWPAGPFTIVHGADTGWR
jgi:3-hydroxybutyryl-CoA dehydrogenase/3-hydroxyacyl-CoA dehydrogenase